MPPTDRTPPPGYVLLGHIRRRPGLTPEAAWVAGAAAAGTLLARVYRRGDRYAVYRPARYTVAEEGGGR